MISKKIVGQLVALSIVSGAASAALPPVIDGNVRAQAPSTSVASSSMVGMYNRLEQLQQEVQQMRGQLEEQSYLIETLKKRQRDLYLDTDRRIVQLESGKVPSTLVGQASSSTISQGASAQASQPIINQANELNGQDKLAYDKAFSSLKSGRYQQSIVDFSSFVSAFPNSVYVPNALYWLGEASYVNRDFKRALEEFSKVVLQYPSHSKAKDAMLKVGFIQYENKQWKQARETLERVTVTFPGTTVASLAKKRLDRLSQEKH
ncbi:MAG: tol-pal system protein YbgF [Cycloclasticus sp.]|nr:tol-pal system protein YbgF [Cycloclasticus sp.]